MPMANVLVGDGQAMKLWKKSAWTHNRLVAGSNPAGPTFTSGYLKKIFRQPLFHENVRVLCKQKTGGPITVSFCQIMGGPEGIPLSFHH
jgi:hypothetical protein